MRTTASVPAEAACLNFSTSSSAMWTSAGAALGVAVPLGAAEVASEAYPWAESIRLVASSTSFSACGRLA
eukprot:8251604-Alexandrium_andersonii.AAC.1